MAWGVGEVRSPHWKCRKMVGWGCGSSLGANGGPGPSIDGPLADARLPAIQKGHISGSIKLVSIFFSATGKLYINTAVSFLIVSTFKTVYQTFDFRSLPYLHYLQLFSRPQVLVIGSTCMIDLLLYVTVGKLQ